MTSAGHAKESPIRVLVGQMFVSQVDDLLLSPLFSFLSFLGQLMSDYRGFDAVNKCFARHLFCKEASRYNGIFVILNIYLIYFLKHIGTQHIVSMRYDINEAMT